MEWTRTHSALATAILIATVAVSVAPFISSLGGMVDPTLTIYVESHGQGGPDVVVLTEHHLETLVVNVSLGECIRGFPISIYHFYATTSLGEHLWCSGLVEDTSLFLEPDQSLSFGIYFEVHDDDTVISVEYRKPSGEVLSTPAIPE